MAQPYEGVSGNQNKPGILGRNTADGVGVAGETDGGRGVSGSSKTFQGVYGHSDANAGVVGESEGLDGVWGDSHAQGFSGVSGRNNHPNGGNGVWGGSDAGRGVTGVSRTSQGVYGHSDANAGVVGESEGLDGVWGDSHAQGFSGVSGRNNHPNGGNGVWGGSDAGRGVVGVSKVNVGVFGSSETFEGVHGETNSPNTAAVAGINNNSGVGLYGKSARGDAGFFDGNVTITGHLSFAGADCAEEFDLADDAAEPGTVMVLEADGTLRASDTPYDTRVAGVVSGAGAYVPGIVLDAQQPDSTRAPIALMGKTYCKVDAGETGIAAGDLLTTSAAPGCAMRVSDPARALGAVIGKALAPWRTGQGLIPILVTLQ
jgi:hypothetical protein